MTIKEDNATITFSVEIIDGAWNIINFEDTLDFQLKNLRKDILAEVERRKNKSNIK